MINIDLAIEVAATTAKDVYFPVPCRGIVHAVHCVYSEETDLDETVIIYRGANAVNTVTPPADATAEGVRYAGVPDTTYKDYIFDPDDDTEANQVLKISIPNTYDTAGMLGLNIKYDDSAAVTQSST